MDAKGLGATAAVDEALNAPKGEADEPERAANPVDAKAAAGTWDSWSTALLAAVEDFLGGSLPMVAPDEVSVGSSIVMLEECS